MEYNAEEMFRAVAALAAKGWKICKLWGVRNDLKCTCGKPECPTPGKHPSGGSDWQHRATDEEADLAHWFEAIEEHTRINVGVRLGPTSGIIDVEYDSDDAKKALEKYGLDQIDTPAYSSGRGVHRIFQHEDWMPDSGVVKVEGIEVRIGGGGKASQSVIPPSWHKSGKKYQWLPGRSPDDVNPARLPTAFREAVLAASRRQGSGITAQARKALRAAEKISEGGRHAFLVGIASRQAGRIRRFSDDEKAELSQLLVCVNAALCNPPKSESEVLKIASDQFAYYRDRAIARRVSGTLRFEEYGLVWDIEERCWLPGEWRLTIVQSEPAEFKLRIPHPDGGKEPLTVRLSADDWFTPKRVAVKVVQASGKIDLMDPNPARWVKIWNGESIRNDEGNWENTRGLRCSLSDIADYEIPTKESNLSTYHASVFLSYLDGFPKTESGDDEDARQPNHSGVPKWIFSKRAGEWRLWLKWPPSMAAAWKKAGLGSGYLDAGKIIKEELQREVGEKRLPESSKVWGGKSGKWFVLREYHIAALQKIADSI